MASTIIGRAACPECDFASAHIKQSDKCLFRYCPECHTQTFAKTEAQQERMRAKMRPVVAVAPVVVVPVAAVAPALPASASAAPTVAPTAAKPKPPVRSGLFGWS